MQIDIDYPSLEAERQILVSTTGAVNEVPIEVMDGNSLMKAQNLVRHIPVGESVMEAILTLVREGRRKPAAYLKFSNTFSGALAHERAKP